MKRNVKDKRAEMLRTHPLEILHRLKRYAFLLILPFLQGLLVGTGSVAQRLSRSGINALLVSAVVALAFFQWRRYRYAFQGDNLTVEQGVFLHTHARLPLRHVDFLSMESTPWLSLFRTARLHVETPGASRRLPDFSFFLSKRMVQDIFTLLSTGEEGSDLFRTRPRHLVLLAASWSNAASGLLLAIPFLQQLSRIMGEDFAKRIHQAADISQWLVFSGLPPLAASVVWILMAGWLVAFLSRLFRHARFRAYLSGGFIVTESGLVSRRRHLARRTAINGITIQQSLPMAFLRMQAVYLQVVGYGKQKGERALLAAGDRTQMGEAIETLTGLRRVESRKLKPISRTRYLFASIALLTAAAVLFAAALILWPWLWQYTVLLWGFISLLGLWRLCVCWLGFKTSGLRFSAEAIELSTYRNFSLVRAVLPRRRIQEIRISQSRLQQIKGTCTVSLGARGESKRTMAVRGLRYDEVMDCLAQQP